MAGPGWYFIGQEELDEVIDVLTTREMSRYRFDGDEVQSVSKVYQFEREFEAFTNAKYCLGLNSCTSALLAGLAALGIGPGDEVIVPGYTFIASIAAIAYSRAIPILAEIDESLTIDPEDILRKITSQTKGIMAVHMLGAPCNMDMICRIAAKRGIHVIEDVAQACGGSYKNAKLGNIGDVGAFSLNIFKTITAGDGGILTTNDATLYERAFAFHDHGSKPFRLGIADNGSLLGLNLRMHELTGAVGLAQVRKLDQILALLRKKKLFFKEALSSIADFRFRILHDEQGECSTVVVLLFETQSIAERIATAIGSKTLLRSGKHYYGNMVQLLNKNMPARHGCPFDCNAYSSSVAYAPGMLPRTDDILGRAICLSVGVRDSYLGADFGIDVMTSEEGILDKVEEFKQRTKHILP